MGQKKYNREEQAAKEIGQTDVSRGVALFLCGIFLALIFAVPLLQLVHDFNNQERCEFFQVVPSASEIGFFFTGGPAPESLDSVQKWDGEQTPGIWNRFLAVNARTLKGIGQLEDCMTEKSILTTHLLPGAQRVLTSVGGVGNEKAYLGRDGWLFFRTGLDYLLGRGFLEPDILRSRLRGGSEFSDPPEPNPIVAIVELRDRLAMRNIELVVLPTPVKAAIYPERFSQRYDERSDIVDNPSAGRLKQELDKHGVHVFDAAQVLHRAKDDTERALYLLRDTHWSPSGMERVATALAEFIDERGLLTLPVVSTDYSREPIPVKNAGDIERMLKLGEEHALYPPQQVEIHRVMDDQGRPWKPSRDSQVLLLGDSFTNIYSLGGMGWGELAGLAPQLSAQLHRPIDVISQNDAGSHATRSRLNKQLSEGIDRLQGKELVIYQFVERELAVGDWKTGFEYRLGEAPSKATTQEDAATPLTVKGRVQSVMHCPSAADVVYKDCFFPVSLTNLESSGPREHGIEIVVYLWGLLNGSATSHSKIQPGDQLELSIVSYGSVEERFASYNHMELSGAAAQLPTYWGDLRSPGSSDGDGPVQETPPMSSQSAVLSGTDGFLFLNSELKHLRAGVFWGEAAGHTSLATNQANRDPLPAILDFKRQLDELDVSLLVVPVPLKATVYSDKLGEIKGLGSGDRQQQFYQLLRQEGVDVLDLTGPFEARRGVNSSVPLYCHQDSHWSGHGCQMAAEIIAEKIQGLSWYKDVPKRDYQTSSVSIEMAGDLRAKLKGADLPKEKVDLIEVLERTSEGTGPVASWRGSPVVLLGDSHILVFGAGGDMHAKHAGLGDHLAHQLGFPVDLVGVRGSGATPSRVQLRRRGDNLAGKKIIVWVFSVREFTQSRTGWAKVPLTQ